jgi:hypothetical protein
MSCTLNKDGTMRLIGLCGAISVPPKRRLNIMEFQRAEKKRLKNKKAVSVRSLRSEVTKNQSKKS